MIWFDFLIPPIHNLEIELQDIIKLICHIT